MKDPNGQLTEEIRLTNKYSNSVVIKKLLAKKTNSANLQDTNQYTKISSVSIH